MLLNLLNLYSLIIALFDKITDMTKELQRLKPNDTTTTSPVIPSTMIQSTFPSTILPYTDYTTWEYTTMETTTESIKENLTYCYEVTINCPGTQLIKNVTTTVLSILLVSGSTKIPVESTSDLTTYQSSSDSTFYTSDSTFYTTDTTIYTTDSTFPTTTDLYNYDYDYYADDPHGKSTRMYTEEYSPSTTYGSYTSANSFDLSSTTESDEVTLGSTEKEGLCKVTRCYNGSRHDDGTDRVYEMDATFMAIFQKDYKYERANSMSLDMDTRKKLRKLCWETMFGQELIKLTVMDLVSYHFFVINRDIIISN
jgi:hypothetical protein